MPETSDRQRLFPWAWGIGLVVVVLVVVTAAIAGTLLFTGGERDQGTVGATSDSASDDLTSDEQLTVDDIRVDLTIRSKQCFGEQGCNVGYRIKPVLVQDVDYRGSYDVTYKVVGGEDGPVINTFTIDENRDAQTEAEELVSTKTRNTRLRAFVTSVRPTG